MFRAFLWTVAFSCVLAGCSSPEGELKATPRVARVGQLVVIDAGHALGESAPAWHIQPATENFKVVGRTAFFSAEAPGSYTVFVAKVSWLRPRIEAVTIIVGADDLSLRVREWCDIKNKDDIRTAAQNFLSVAARIRSGQLRTPEEIIEATVAGNRSLKEDWSKFGEKLRAWLNSQQSIDHARVWETIGQTLMELASDG